MEDEINLGACCICELENESVRNILMLDKKAVVAGHGWGCFVCSLASDGAVAVVCDDCFDKMNSGEVGLKFASRGYPSIDGRVPIEELTDDFGHDMSKHPSETLAEFDEPGGMQDFIKCRNCRLITAVVEGKCAKCGEEICIVCGCTDSAACPEGCYWTRPNVCSQCDAETVADFLSNK